MYRVIVFAGTTEGNEVCRFLEENKIPVWACVATEYGSRSLEEGEYLHVTARRFTAEEMKELFLREQPELVLDATHPYAPIVTENIQAACAASKTEYLRLLREQSPLPQRCIYAENAAQAVLRHFAGKEEVCELSQVQPEDSP